MVADFARSKSFFWTDDSFSGSEPEMLPSDSLVQNELIIVCGLMERDTHSFAAILLSNPERFSE
jgi:hypothetical protein